MEHITYIPKGVCSRQIDIDIEENVIKAVKFTGGCSGNTQGVAALLAGMEIDEAISRLQGIKCHVKPTSCPDQVACALEAYKNEKKDH